MDDEVGFLLELAANPNDFTTHLVYADWLQERDDSGVECLRLWVELVQQPYDDATYRELLLLLERFRAALRVADPDWVKLLAEARPWVGAGLAEVVARLHLRVRHGRKAERQWVDRPVQSAIGAVWNVSYYRNQQDFSGSYRWRMRRNLQVDQVTAEVHESGNMFIGRPPDAVS